MPDAFHIGQEFERQKTALPGAAAVQALRQQGIEDFLIKGLPTAKTEGWRYADLKRLDLKAAPAAAAKARARAIQGVSGWPLVVVSETGLEGVDAIPGRSLKTAAAVAETKGPLGQALFLPAAHDHPFDQLNRAFAKDGFVLDIPAGEKVSGLEIALASAGLTGGVRYRRNLIRVGAGASAAIYLRTLSDDESGWLNLVTKIELEEGARLDLFGDFDAGREVLLSSLLGARIAKGARLAYCSLAGGIASLRHEIHAALDGEGAELALSGGLLAAEGEVVDTLTQVTHAGAGAASRQLFKAIAGAKGRTAFQGRIVVEENAVKTDARQECRNLLLDREAEANVKPELLIFADDVACSHGATVGEVDAAALFYLTQRGIPETEARRILVQAFLSEIFEKVSNPAIRAAFEGKADRWMQRNFGGTAAHE